MPDDVSLDTFGLLALLSSDDQYHAEASRTFAGFGAEGRTVVTTNLVLAEVGNGLARTALRDEVGWLINQLHTDPAAHVFYIEQDLFLRGLDFYLNRHDKAWGLVDCITFVLMQEMQIIDAFTGDHHFQQAGFRCLFPLRR